MQVRSKSNGTGVLTLPTPAGGTSGARTDLPAPINEATARLLGGVGVVAIGVIHILDAAPTYHDTPWIFWAYLALIVAAIPVTLWLLHWPSPLAWGAAVALAAAPLAGYVWSRSIGLPGDAPDIGNWLCTLGIAALFVETSLLALGVTRLGMWWRSR